MTKVLGSRHLGGMWVCRFRGLECAEGFRVISLLWYPGLCLRFRAQVAIRKPAIQQNRGLGLLGILKSGFGI